MLTKSIAKLLAFATVMGTTAQVALAQRPPSGNQGPPQMSLERAWAWLMARPGVVIALVVIAVAIAYMVITKRKSRT